MIALLALPNNSLNPTRLSMAFINIGCWDLGYVVASAVGLILSLDVASISQRFVLMLQGSFRRSIIISCIIVMLTGFATPPARAQSSEHYEFELYEWEDLMIRLDNSLIEFINEPYENLYVFVYGGQNRRQGEADAWVACIKNHLLNRRGSELKRRNVKPDRIIIMHGGYRENVTLELWFLPRGEQTPSAKPTIEPQDVKFRGRINRNWRSLCKS